MAEGSLGLQAHAQQAEKLENEESWWSVYRFELVSAWLRDYKDQPLSEEELRDREAVIKTISILVVNGQVKRPPGKHPSNQGDALLENFGRYAEFYPSFLVGTHHARHDQRAWVTPRGYESDEGDMPSDDEDAPMDEHEEKAPRRLSGQQQAPTPKPISTAAATHAHKAQSSSAQAGGEPADGSLEDDCPHCLADRPPDTRSMRFVCVACARRSDKAINDPINVELRRAFEEQQRIEALRPVQAAGLVDSASSSSGQSKGDTRPAAPTGTANDRLCDAELARGGDFPLFVGPQAGAPLSASEALERVRAALNGQGYERPSDKLVELIRAGKLHHVGWAVPRKFDVGPGAAGASQLNFVDGQLVVGTEARKALHPACDNSHQFAVAMFTTIIPALIDRPEALMQWVTLGRTALEIEQQQGWQAASIYMAHLLQERVTTHQPFAHVSQQALASVNQLRYLSSSEQRGAPRPGALGPPQQSVAHQLCNNYNLGYCNEPCQAGRRHACSRCGAAHPAKACPKQGPPGSGGFRPSQQQARPWRQYDAGARMRSMPPLDAGKSSKPEPAGSH